MHFHWLYFWLLFDMLCILVLFKLILFSFLFTLSFVFDRSNIFLNDVDQLFHGPVLQIVEIMRL